MRTTTTAVVAVLVTALGVVGLARGAEPQGASASSGSSMSMDMGTNSGAAEASSAAITVTGAYVREPASPDVAAAYFTVHNNSGKADTLQTVLTGAGEESDLHTDSGTSMADMPNGIPIPAHGSVTLTPGGEHVMIQKLIGTLKPGQTVDLQLQFANAGTINVVAPVIAILAPAPTDGATK
jgi:copper(I)-binding protein